MSNMWRFLLMMVVWLCAHTLTTSPSPASHDAGAAARAAGVTLTTR
jgi:hypothetical protein